jgi:hypothetical protein
LDYDEMGENVEHRDNERFIDLQGVLCGGMRII